MTAFRTRRLSILVSALEHSQLSGLAFNTGLSKSDWVRLTIREQYLKMEETMGKKGKKKKGC